MAHRNKKTEEDWGKFLKRKKGVEYKDTNRFLKRKVNGKTVDKYNKKKDKWVKGGPWEPATPVKRSDLDIEGKKRWDELRNPH